MFPRLYLKIITQHPKQLQKSLASISMSRLDRRKFVLCDPGQTCVLLPGSPATGTPDGVSKLILVPVVGWGVPNTQPEDLLSMKEKLDLMTEGVYSKTALGISFRQDHSRLTWRCWQTHVLHVCLDGSNHFCNVTLLLLFRLYRRNHSQLYSIKAISFIDIQTSI